jgi:hypothetical protein
MSNYGGRAQGAFFNQGKGSTRNSDQVHPQASQAYSDPSRFYDDRGGAAPYNSGARRDREEQFPQASRQQYDQPAARPVTNYVKVQCAFRKADLGGGYTAATGPCVNEGCDVTAEDDVIPKLCRGKTSSVIIGGVKYIKAPEQENKEN